MKKFYSKYLNFQFTVYTKDTRFVFDFTPLEGNQYGVIYLHDKEQIRAIIDTDEFKKGIVFEDTAEDGTEDVPKYEGMTVMSDITNFQEAKNLLAGEPYSVSVAELKSKEKVVAKAAELGIVFPNLK